MKNCALILSICILFFSCKKEEKVAVCKKEKKFEMYQASEMAGLMEQMYAENSALKQRIINGETIGEFPEYYNTIFTAKFTDATDNDVFFKENAQKYITAQKLIYSDNENIKLHFNDGVNACIACHQSKCGGPIPRIKKLFIQ